MTTTLILIRGVFKGGCFLSCLYPPLTRKNMKKEKMHIYCFESPDFYVHIKAISYVHAVRRFCSYFGRDALHHVEHIHSSESSKKSI